MKESTRRRNKANFFRFLHSQAICIDFAYALATFRQPLYWNPFWYFFDIRYFFIVRFSFWHFKFLRRRSQTFQNMHQINHTIKGTERPAPGTAEGPASSSVPGSCTLASPTPRTGLGLAILKVVNTLEDEPLTCT